METGALMYIKTPGISQSQLYPSYLNSFKHSAGQVKVRGARSDFTCWPFQQVQVKPASQV